MHQARRTQAGQTIYLVMLVLACVAVLVALTFPVCEYILLYHGPVRMEIATSGGARRARSLPREPAAPAAEPEPGEAPTPVEKPAPAEAPASGETPTPGEAPKPVEKPGETKPETPPPTPE